MRAIKVDDAEMDRMARDEKLEVMKPELGTRPRVYYRNLWRYAKAFIGGSVSAEQDGVVDCVEGARVRLLRAGQAVAETRGFTVVGGGDSAAGTSDGARRSDCERRKGDCESED